MISGLTHDGGKVDSEECCEAASNDLRSSHAWCSKRTICSSIKVDISVLNIMS